MSLWLAAPASLNPNAEILARSSSPTPCAAIWKWPLPSIYAAKPTCSVFDLLLPHLFPRYLKLRPDERLDSLRTGQPQAQQRAFAWSIGKSKNGQHFPSAATHSANSASETSEVLYWNSYPFSSSITSLRRLVSLSVNCF